MRVRDAYREQPFSFDLLYEHPGELHSFDDMRARKNVGILGAGTAGLTAGFELTRLGHQVTIFEASARVGGRIRTHRFADGSHGELGAMRIPSNHHATLNYIRKFNLPTRRFVNYNPRAKYILRGVQTRLEEWRELLEMFDLRPSEVDDPRLLYEKTMKNAWSCLSVRDHWSIFGDEPLQGRVAAYDATTLWEYLRSWRSDEAIEYMGNALGMLQYQRASFLETLIDFYGLYNVDQVELVDGMEALPRAMGRSLEGAIRFSARVTQVEITSDNRVRVTWLDGSATKSSVHDYVICCLPAPVLSRIDFSPPLGHRQSQALRSVSYASAAKTLVYCTERPWEFTDGIYGGGSYTDQLTQQIWYPSDNSVPAGEDRTVSFTGGDSSDPDSAYSAAPLYYSAQSADASRSPGVLTAAYMWETNARRFAAIDDGDRTAAVLKILRQFHPEIERYVEDVVHLVWDYEQSPGFGAFAYFGPGEHQRYLASLAMPHPIEKPRIFFAGEHLAVAHAWIQGAIQTALDAVINVLMAEPRLTLDITDPQVQMGQAERK